MLTGGSSSLADDEPVPARFRQRKSAPMRTKDPNDATVTSANGTQ
jgi:hypothetical protein